MEKKMFFMCVLFGTVAARQLTNEELHGLPKLFHLDDYERCLAQKDGLYCLGTFELTASQPEPILDLIKVYQSHITHTFNRTLLHRGYCVSERCRSVHEASERQDTLRFERCAAKYVRHSLTPRLVRLHYCTTHREHQENAIRPPSGSQRAFLYVVYGILLLNVSGTLYHCFSRHSNKNGLLMAWSLPSNWARFTRIERSGMYAALAPLQSIRLWIQWIVMFAHCILAQNMVYVQNAEYLENIKYGFIGSLIKNGTEMVQVFIFISCFLTGYNLLSTIYKTEVNSKMLLKWILKRLIRILPVYLLVIGYMITWFPHAGDGPLWSTIAGKEREICRRKLWTHILFINNLVDSSEMCMIQTWALAVDMQLYIFSTLLTLLLVRLKVRAVPILAGLFVASGVVTVVLAYMMRLDPMTKMIYPENLRKLFQETPSFHYVHTSPWINIPACFLGLLMANLFFEKTKKKVKIDGPEQNDSTENDGRTQNFLGDNIRMQKLMGFNGQTLNEMKDKSQTWNVLGDNGRTQNGLGDNTRIQNIIYHYEHIQSKKWDDDGRTQNEMGGDERTQHKAEEKNGTTRNVDERNRFTKSGEYEINKPIKTEVNKSFGTKNGMERLLQNHLFRKAPLYVTPGLVIWVMLASTIERIESPALTALYIGMEHSVYSLVFAVSMIQVFTIDSFMRRLLTWPGWYSMGRLVFCVMVLHWCVNLSIVMGRPTIRTSMFYICMDFLGTLFFSNLLALPVCLLVELPAQKFLDLLLLGSSTRAQI